MHSGPIIWVAEIGRAGGPGTDMNPDRQVDLFCHRQIGLETRVIGLDSQILVRYFRQNRNPALFK